MIHPKEQAEKLWKIHQRHWGHIDSELIAKQRITIQLNSFMQFFPMTEKENDYLIQVCYYIYRIGDNENYKFIEL